ncbi:MAG: hypothetical protein WD767_03755 [Alphaproteobacteria bacterium]
MRFLRNDYWKMNTSEGRVRKRGTNELEIEYYDSLADGFIVRGWIEPDRWKPVWRGPNREGVYTITNPPRLGFRYVSGGFPHSGPKTSFRGGSLDGGYRRGDKEHLRFLNAVIRLSAKFTSNTHDFHVSREDRWNRDEWSMLWIGHDLLRWASEDDSRRIDGNARPATSWTMPDLPRWYDE